MDMCRIAYDAATLWDYPPDISTVFLYRQNKKEPINLKHGMFAGTDWNSPEDPYISGVTTERIKNG